MGLFRYCFLFGSLICYNIKYVKRINGTAQRRCHATTRIAIFVIQESKAKVPQGGKDLAITHMWSKHIFRNVTLTFNWFKIPPARIPPGRKCPGLLNLFCRLQLAYGVIDVLCLVIDS